MELRAAVRELSCVHRADKNELPTQTIQSARYRADSNYRSQEFPLETIRECVG